MIVPVVAKEGSPTSLKWCTYNIQHHGGGQLQLVLKAMGTMGFDFGFLTETKIENKNYAWSVSNYKVWMVVKHQTTKEELHCSGRRTALGMRLRVLGDTAPTSSRFSWWPANKDGRLSVCTSRSLKPTARCYTTWTICWRTLQACRFSSVVTWTST